MGALRHPDPWSRSTLVNPTLDSGSHFQNANSPPRLPSAFCDCLFLILIFSQRAVGTDESHHGCPSREGRCCVLASDGDVEDPGVFGFGLAHSLFGYKQFSRARGLCCYEENVGGGSLYG